MTTFNYIITDELGIHSRPAGKFVKLAKTFSADITMTKDGNQADGKRLLAIMALGIKQGHEITVSCDGEDEKKASEALESFVKEIL